MLTVSIVAIFARVPPLPTGVHWPVGFSDKDEYTGKDDTCAVSKDKQQVLQVPLKS